MIEPGAITVRCRWQDGAFLLWGEVGQRVMLDEQELKTYLFGWHRPSLYGTFIETQEREYKAVAVLPAAMALDYFCDPAVLKHARLRFAEEMERLKAAKGRDAEILFLQLMIRHHEGGVDMARGALRLAERPEVRTMARHIVSSQNSEIDLMTELLKERGAERLPSILQEQGS